MPFAAVLGSALVFLLARLVFWIAGRMQSDGYESGWFFLYVDPLTASCASGFAYVEIVKTVAPRSKFRACVVMTTLQTALRVFLVVYVWVSGNHSEDPVMATLESIAWIGTAIVVTSHLDRDPART